MALPKLLQKLFQNGGAGDKLNPEIVPEIKKLMLGDHVLELQADGTLKLDEKLVITSAGGTMTGAIYGSGGMICGETDASDVWISGGTNSSSNSYIQINGGSRTKQAGEIILVPKTPTGSYSLRATASGLLKWGDKEVERVNSSGDKWIRYENGLQICWGFQSISSSTKITYAVPFANNVIVQVGGIYVGSSYYIAIPGSSNTTCSFTVVKISSGLVELPPADAPSFSWLAIGRWK